MSAPASSARRALRSSARGSGLLRSFSASTCSRHGGIPTFYEPSKPELEPVLRDLRQRVFLPQHLNREQRKLIFKEANRTRLEADPVYTTVADEEFPLEHLDRTKDIPSRWKLYKAAIERAETKNDWENAARILEGFKSARIIVARSWNEKWLRHANKNMMQPVIVRSLQRVRQSGLSLGSRHICLLAFLSMRTPAWVNGWDGEQVEKALGQAEQLALLMELEDHCGSREVWEGDPRASSAVLGVLCELAAARAYFNTEGKDVGGLVKTYAERLTAALEREHKASFKSDYPNAWYEPQDVRDVERWISIFHALTLSTKVLGPHMPRSRVAQEAAQVLLSKIHPALESQPAIRKTDVYPKAWRTDLMWEACIR